MFPIQFFVLYYPCIHTHTHTQLWSIKSRVMSSCGSWWYTRQMVIIRGWASLIPRHEPGNEARGELEQDLLKLMRMGQGGVTYVSMWWSHAMLTRKCMPNMIVFKWLWVKQLASVYLSWLSQTRSASGALMQKCSMQTVFCKCAYINGPTAKW